MFMQHITFYYFFALCILNKNKITTLIELFLFVCFFVCYIVKGPAPIQIPAVIYTGGSMTLTCGPPNIQMGQISDSKWTFNGQKIIKSTRFEITSGLISKLTVNNVILADIGKSAAPAELSFLFL